MNESLTELLSLEIPTQKPGEDGFLEIAGMSHYENVNSRIYAYFLDQEREGKLSDLFLNALINVVNRKTEKCIILDGFWTQTEVRTDKGNRIDIVLEDASNESVILVENKIYHHLANDLNDYWNHFKKYKDEAKIGILLTLEAHPIDNEFKNRFINITHIEWIEEIKKIGLPAGLAHKTYVYLNDFFQTIENLTKNQDMNELAKFYFQNQNQVLKAVQTRTEAENFVLEQVNQLAAMLELQVYGQSFGWRNIWDQQKKRKTFYTISYDQLLNGENYVYVILELEQADRDFIPEINAKLSHLWQHSNLMKESWKDRNSVHFLSKKVVLDKEHIEKLGEYIFQIIDKEFKPIYDEILKIIDFKNAIL